MNRALRAAAMGMLLCSTVALSACSAGQVNQTASQLRDKTGPAGTGSPELLATARSTGTQQVGAVSAPGGRLAPWHRCRIGPRDRLSSLRRPT